MHKHSGRAADGANGHGPHHQRHRQDKARAIREAVRKAIESLLEKKEHTKGPSRR